MNIITRSQAIEQGLKTYFTGKPCKHGHIAERILPSCNCLVCLREHAIKARYSMTDEQKEAKRARGRKYAAKNKEARSAYHKEYYKKNKEKIAEKSRKWFAENKDRVYANRAALRAREPDRIKEKSSEYTKKYRAKNPEKINAYQSQYRKEKYANDTQWKAAFRIRAMLARVLGQTKQPKWAKSEEMIGYTRSELINHLDSLLKDGMTWDNFGEWHIDHIKPVSAFIKEGVTDPAVVNALSNLQPLWAEDNFKKSDSYE